MKMPGGGSWAVGPGQITDDSEMTFCLMNALIQSNIDSEAFINQGHSNLNTEQIGIFYKEWIKSDPDLMGPTTGKALKPLLDINEGFTKAIHEHVEKNKDTSASISNGALMRCTPIAVWGCNLSVE